MSRKNTEAFNRLVTIMDELREQCPWDKKQTIHTLRQLTIEETYELADSITETNWRGIKEELGDILLHIVFYAKIAAEQKQFTLDEVIHAVCEKLIHRHPHIYSDTHVNDEEDVKKNWEKLKLKEGKKSVLSGVPKSLPAMVKAMRLQEKAKQTGFEWENKEQVWDKVKEEMNELHEAINNLQTATNCADKAQIESLSGNVEDELGDVFFSLINFARFLHVDAENALERTNKKFISRFTKMEALALENGKHLQDMTLEEMDDIWNIIKKQKQQIP
ncbi:MAG: nucleoside triphosphate pyrophosphohydrolase [Ferruginibacter sp.]|nr:nucleoside triphosphate pyrophosphohydrolase [Bacteroidota bacterium]MBX2919536.1 nucleoside triphosphate pyrophosphohydrolase [Ferruginibacter sp.]